MCSRRHAEGADRHVPQRAQRARDDAGLGALISGNTASSNGNAGQGYGIYVANTYPQAGHVSAAATITGNTVNFNIGYGIYAQVPMVDGGKNVAKGNSQLVQCVSVACG